MAERETTSEQVQPSVTVIVCTRDRALSLKNTLCSLAQLGYPAYEVVVVDNARILHRRPSIEHGQIRTLQRSYVWS